MVTAIRPERRFIGAYHVLASFVVLLGTAASLQAGIITPSQLPTITVAIEGESGPPEWVFRPPVQGFLPPTAKGKGYGLANPHAADILQNRAHVEILEFEFDPDPFVLNNILVTNVTGVTQTYSVFIGLPTSFAAPNT